MAKRSPFPGMDPYLEDPRLWRGVHTSIMTYLRDEIAERLPARYYARLEDRVYLDTPEPRLIGPDVRVVERPHGGRAATAAAAVLDADPAVVLSVAPEEVAEHFIEIHDAATGHRVVTVIEVLSPTNKRAGAQGTRSYLEKQREVLQSDANLVEIDLIRGGEHVAAVPPELVRLRCGAYHYLVAIRRSARPDHREVYPVRLADRLPRIAVPLRAPDTDVVADLQAVLQKAYEMGSYGETIDYAKPPVPPLAAEEADWAQGLLRQA